MKKYTGCKVDSFSLEGAAGDYVKFTVSVKAKDESTGSLASLSALALQSFKTVNATLTLGGTTYDSKSVKFNLKNNLQDVGQTYGSGLYNLEPIHGQREATVDIDLNYGSDTETLFDTNYVTDTKIASIVWTLKSPSVVTGSTNYTVTITLNNVAITSVERNVNGAGVLVAKVSDRRCQSDQRSQWWQQLSTQRARYIEILSEEAKHDNRPQKLSENSQGGIR